jgi:hypothetical protein
MKETDNITMSELNAIAAESQDNSMEDDTETFLRFSKPYQFEEDTYEGIDMSCLDSLTTKDLTDIEKKFYKTGVPSFNPENSATYAKIVIQKASGMPIEFFDQLPIKEMMRIKSQVVSFFYG